MLKSEEALLNHSHEKWYVTVYFLQSRFVLVHNTILYIIQYILCEIPTTAACRSDTTGTSCFSLRLIFA